MKQMIIVSLIIILIPYLVVTFFIEDDEIKFDQTKELVVRIKKEDNSITSVPFEEYIVGVLAGEMPANFEFEALKAQAVAARSYVLKKMENNKKDYDVVDTVMNQVYLDENKLKEKWKDSYVEKVNKIKMVVVETKGEYLTYNDNIVEAFFFSTSSGKTENVEEVFSEALPYLRSVDSSWDEQVSPVFSETLTFSLEEFYNKLGLNYSDNLKIEILKATSTGRTKQIIINEKEFTGSQVTSALSLRSTFFSINKVDKQVLITTKGYGHGVGMSQYGAEAMAKNGYKYVEILKYYYQGVEIKKL